MTNDKIILHITNDLKWEKYTIEGNEDLTNHKEFFLNIFNNTQNNKKMNNHNQKTDNDTDDDNITTHFCASLAKRNKNSSEQQSYYRDKNSYQRKQIQYHWI